jgi:micrococcal nuclease
LSGIVVSAVLLGAPAACAGPLTERPPAEQNAVSVVAVTDDARATLRIDGRDVPIRLIAVDAAFARRLGCDGDTGDVLERSLVAGELRLEFEAKGPDPGEVRQAWVWAGDRLVNAAVLRAGAATLARYWPAQRYETAVQRAQLAAARAGVGLWGSCAALSGILRSGKRCDPSYPGRCVPPFPPDLSCEEISFANLRIAGPDLHDLDGDGDGLGCERFNPM